MPGPQPGPRAGLGKPAGLPEFPPAFGYNRRLQGMEPGERAGLKSRLRDLSKKLNGFGSLEVDELKMRLLTSENLVIRNADRLKSLKLIPAIVTEYPTHDHMTIELEIL